MDDATRTRKLKLLAITTTLLVLAAIVIGALLADRLMPVVLGAPSHALPMTAEATVLDREVSPVLANHPGESGAVLLNDGLDAFAARAISARSAGRSLDLQYYMWHDDLTGRLLALEAWKAAERGVRVRMLLDDMNARGLDPKLMTLDAHPLVEIRLYNPFRNRTGVRRLLETLVRALRVNHRMHNKAWIADGRVAIVGGRNIGEEYFNAAEDTNFRDLDLLLMGPAVQQAEAIFDQFWNDAAVVPVAALSEQKPENLMSLVAGTQALGNDPAARRYLARVEAAPGVRDFMARQLRPYWSEHIEVVSDPPQKWKHDDRSGWLVDRLVSLIGTSTTRASLISPYFVPGDPGTEGLVGLARNGADVSIVTNSLAANDVPAVHSGYSRYRKRLLEGGVDLFELRARTQADTAGLFGSSGASLHTKAFVIDGERGFIGSFNLDPRSAMLNTEMGVLFNTPGLGAALEGEFDHLASPACSYAVSLLANGNLQWTDGSVQPPAMHDREPDASLGRRMVARVLGWLPIESQL